MMNIIGLLLDINIFLGCKDANSKEKEKTSLSSHIDKNSSTDQENDSSSLKNNNDVTIIHNEHAFLTNQSYKLRLIEEIGTTPPNSKTLKYVIEKEKNSDEQIIQTFEDFCNFLKNDLYHNDGKFWINFITDLKKIAKKYYMYYLGFNLKICKNTPLVIVLSANKTLMRSSMKTWATIFSDDPDIRFKKFNKDSSNNIISIVKYLSKRDKIDENIIENISFNSLSGNRLIVPYPFIYPTPFQYADKSTKYQKTSFGKAIYQEIINIGIKNIVYLEINTIQAQTEAQLHFRIIPKQKDKRKQIDIFTGDKKYNFIY